MADVAMFKAGDGTHPSLLGNTKHPYLVELDIDFAKAATVKGSALAAADVIQAISVPKGSVVIGAGVVKQTALEGTVSALTVGVGDDASASVFVSGYDLFAAALKDVSTLTASNGVFRLYNTANTIDVTLSTLTGTLTGGKVKVWAVLLDVSADKVDGIAQLGS